MAGSSNGWRAARRIESAIGRQRRRDAVDELRKARPRLDDIEIGGDAQSALEVVGSGPERVGQGEKNAQHLLVFLLRQRDDFVVDLDRASGSRNRLAPLDELPWMIPGMEPRCSARTTIT